MVPRREDTSKQTSLASVTYYKRTRIHDGKDKHLSYRHHTAISSNVQLLREFYLPYPNLPARHVTYTYSHDFTLSPPALCTLLQNYRCLTPSSTLFERPTPRRKAQFRSCSMPSIAVCNSSGAPPMLPSGKRAAVTPGVRTPRYWWRRQSAQRHRSLQGGTAHPPFCLTWTRRMWESTCSISWRKKRRRTGGLSSRQWIRHLLPRPIPSSTPSPTPLAIPRSTARAIPSTMPRTTPRPRWQSLGPSSALQYASGSTTLPSHPT